MAIFNLKILVTADDAASGKLKKNATAIDKLTSSVSQAVLGYGAFRAAQKAIEFVKFGAAVQATESRFVAFAGGAARADEMLQALNKASDNTLDRLGAMTTASTLMSLGLATTTEEMGTAGAMLGKLARGGLGAEGAMNSLTMLLANQSTRRLDDFSLSVEEVKNRQAELEAQGYATEAAFKMAVYAAATEKLKILGDMSELTATKIGQLESAGKTVGQIFSSSFAASIGEAITGTKDLGEWVNKAEPGIRAFALSMGAMINPSGWGDAARAWKEAGKAAYDMGQGADEAGRAIQGYNGYVAPAIEKTRVFDTSTEDLFTNMANAPRVIGGYADSAEWLTETLEEQRKVTEELANSTRQFTLDASADWTAYAQDTTESVAEAAADKEKIEQTHADKLATIQKKGQATSLQVNAEAEQAKIDKLRERLTIALQQESEFTDKTKESTKMAKDLQITSLQEEIIGKETLLADYHAGRLVSAGQNVDGLLAEEDRRYAAELEKLNESRVEQELAQTQSLGRMVLANWNAWAEINKVSDETMFNMQMFIQEKYGLITEEGAEMARNMVADFEIIKAGGIDAFQQIKAAQDAIARHIALTFSVREVGKAAAEEKYGSAIPGLGGTPNFASGGTSPGGRTMVGELGAEMVDLPRGSQVTPASQVNDNRTYRFDQTVNTRASTHSIMNDWALAQALAP